MKAKYYPPTFEAREFHCPYCGVFAAQYWEVLYAQTVSGIAVVPFKASYCSHCNRRSYWYEERMMVPSEASVAPAHPDLPQNCVADYDEARDIFARSPRGAAALLRLVIQNLMPDLGEKGENINEDIKHLVEKGLPSMVQQALDFCRVVGNNAVHPGELDVNDSPEVAQRLFEMINFIVDDRIARPREVQALYEKLPASAREAIAKRDGQT